MLANFITLSRLLFGVGALLLFVRIDDWAVAWLWLLLLIMTIGELSDIFDGFVARRLGQVTPLGKLLDPMADAIYRFFVFIGFASAGWMPIWVCAIFFTNYASTAYMRSFATSFGISFDAARWSGKVKSFLQGMTQLLIVLLYILYYEGYLLLDVLLQIRDTLIGVTASVTILATINYGYYFYNLVQRHKVNND